MHMVVKQSTEVVGSEELLKLNLNSVVVDSHKAYFLTLKSNQF